MESKLRDKMTKEHPDYAVFVHRLYDAGRPKTGGLDILLDALVRKGKRILYFESPLLPKVYPFITVSMRTSAGNTELERIQLITNNSPLARLQELLLFLYLPIKYKLKNVSCITSDPLSTTPLVTLRLLGLVGFSYFHCIDYSERRFPNKFENLIYRLLLDYSLSNADLIGCVTKRIETILKDRGFDHLFYIPNSPSISEYRSLRTPEEKRVKNRLVVTCAGISHKYRIKDLVDLFIKIVDKYPDAELVVIGSKKFEPEEYEEIEKYVNSLAVKNKVIFTGQLTKLENIKEISRSWIGLAFYDKSYSHVNFGDSLKIREYAALGIPIVSDKTTPTSLEMLAEHAGIAVDEPWDAYEPLIKLMSDSHLYRDLMNKELNWADKVDKDKVVEELLAKIDNQKRR